MIHLYAMLTFIICSYSYVFRKEIIRFCTPRGEDSSKTKTICFFMLAVVLCLFILPGLINYKFPKTALAILLFTMGFYFLWEKAWKRGKRVPLKNILACGTYARSHYAAGLCMTLIVCGTFCGILSFKTFPLAEGWYSAYARIINEGGMPYRDFELLFTPLYSYIIAFITKIAGYELYVLRVAGLLLFLVLAGVQYAVFAKVFQSPAIGAVSATAATLYMQSEVVQIFYDYIRFFDLCAYLAALFLILFLDKWSKNREKRGINPFVTLSGIIAALSFLIRQNSGALVIAYTIVLFVGLIFVMEEKRALVCQLINYVLSAAVTIGICGVIMASNGMLDLFFEKTMVSAAESKGGMLNVLFAWIPRVLNRCGDCTDMIVFLLLLIGADYLLYRKYHREETFRAKDMMLSLTFGSAVFVGIFFCYFVKKATKNFVALSYTDAIPFVSFFVVLFLFIYELLRIVKNRELGEEEFSFHLLFFAMLGMALAINYGSGTSGSLCQGQTALDVGLILGILLYLSKHKLAEPLRLLILGGSVCLCLTIASDKYVRPYSWWGLKEKDIRSAVYELEVPNARNIKVSESTKRGIEGICKAITENSNQEEPVFVFPHAPVFYVFTDRWPDTYTYVQWFDVSSDEAVKKDIERLEKNPPKVLVHIHVPERVVESHESLFRTGEHSGLYLMDEALKRLEEKENYQLVDSYKIQTYKVDVYSLEDISKKR